MYINQMKPGHLTLKCLLMAPPVFKKGTLKSEVYKTIHNATTNALNELLPNIEQCIENNKLPKSCLESLNNVLANKQWKINCEACKREFEQLIPEHDFTK